MITTERVEEELSSLLNNQGYDMVRVQLSGAIHKTLQIMIDRLDNAAITLEDCERVSRLVSPLLDTLSVSEDPYRLEVSSPGIDRPLVKPVDFIRFVGRAIVVTLKNLVDNRRKIKGILDRADDHGITITEVTTNSSEKKIDVLYEQIASARLSA